MKTRELIVKLLDCEMDAEISIDMSFSGELAKDEGLDIATVEPRHGPAHLYTIITLDKV